MRTALNGLEACGALVARHLAEKEAEPAEDVGEELEVAVARQSDHPVGGAFLLHPRGLDPEHADPGMKGVPQGGCARTAGCRQKDVVERLDVFVGCFERGVVGAAVKACVVQKLADADAGECQHSVGHGVGGMCDGAHVEKTHRNA